MTARLRLVLAAALLLAAAPAAFAGTVDEDLRPGSVVDSTIFPSGETETYRVAAPAGSVLTVDLRPAKGAGCIPTLGATLSDGSGAVLAEPRRPGAWKVRLRFPEDGVLTLSVGSASGVGDYRLKTRLRAPRGVLLEGIVDGEGPSSVEFRAPPAAMAVIRAAAPRGSSLVPRIAGVASGEGSAAPGSTKSGPRTDTWKRVLLPELGPWTLSVDGADGTAGPFAASVRWKVPKGPRVDHRDVRDLAALHGTYTAWLSGAPGGGLFPAFLSGDLAFDGKGGIDQALGTAVLVPDGTNPLGFTAGTLPVEGTRGSYYTDGAAAAVSLDLGGDAALEKDFAVSAGGNILHSGVAVESAGDPGLLLRRVEVPAKAELAGSWFYVNLDPGIGGAGTVEVGVLTLAPGGGVSGIGARSPLTLEGGVPTPGTQTPILRGGTFTVAGDGTVSVTTTENLFGPQSTWTASTVLGADILAGGDGDGTFPAGGGTLLLRQGLGLTDAAIAGDYLHLGIALGAEATLRSGILAFDGGGGFAGTETLAPLAGGGAAEVVESTGTYSVTTQGVATFTPDGGAAGTGVVGPDGTYLLTVSLGSGGLGLDLLLDLGD